MRCLFIACSQTRRHFRTISRIHLITGLVFRLLTACSIWKLAKIFKFQPTNNSRGVKLVDNWNLKAKKKSFFWGLRDRSIIGVKIWRGCLLVFFCTHIHLYSFQFHVKPNHPKVICKVTSWRANSFSCARGIKDAVRCEIHASNDPNKGKFLLIIENNVQLFPLKMTMTLIRT